jgi:hypothetical protein
MPGPIDDTLKHLTELAPQDWVVQGGWPAAPARVIDADIATIAGATDKVIRVKGRPDWLLAVDFQTGHDSVAKLPDLLLYNSALFKRHGLRVRSLLVLLHRGADSPQLTGLYERGFPGEPFDAALRYRVLDVQQQALPSVIARMKQRLERETPPRQAADLWSATYILMGMRYERALVQSLLQGVLTMKESVTYQAIIEEGEALGEAKEARKMILLQGQSKFGEPSAEAEAALNALSDVRQLEKLGVRLLRASSWEELLGSNGPSRRGRSRRKKE